MKPKLLVWITLAVAIIAIGATYFFSDSELPESIPIVTSGHPTIGYNKAKVHLVVFEEPKCSSCIDFTNEIFPKLKEEYIDTNKIQYTIIPVSFLPNSMPAAIATLCVYYANPLYPNSDIFFTYLDYLYKHQPAEHVDWATPEKLVEFARESSPAINLQKLRKCIETESYRVKIEKNTEYGKNIMGGRIMTPTVYVNGIEASELSYEAIRKLIKKVQEHKGVK